MHRIQLSHPSGATAEVSPYGAQVLSWKSPDGRELIYLSPLAEGNPGAAVRGGIPVIFPQFGGPAPLRHGFARNLVWELASQLPDSVTFELSDSTETRLRWPHAFKIALQISLSDGQLNMELQVTNRGVLPFDFTTALHSYLHVESLATTSLHGLQNRPFQDDVTGEHSIDHEDAIHFTEMVDRVYHGAGGIQVKLKSADHQLSFESEGFPDLVVWNPGAEAAAKLRDLPEQGYNKFICVEPAAVSPVLLEPGCNWTAHHRISIDAETGKLVAKI